MTEKKLNSKNPPDRCSSNNEGIEKHIKRAQKIRAKDTQIKQKKEQEKEKLRKLAYALWELNDKQIGRDKQDWKDAEELLKPVYWNILKPVYGMKRYLKFPIKKINWYILISLFISGFCLAALLIHLGYLPLKEIEQMKNEQIKFDNPAVILLFLSLTPWFPIILEKATLPGGWNLEFRKIKEQQYIQSKEIKDLNFLLLHFITDFEKIHLQNLNSSNRFAYEFRQTFEEELRRLLALKLIERHPGKGIRSARNDKDSNYNDLKKHFYITDKGKEYLERIKWFDKDEE